MKYIVKITICLLFFSFHAYAVEYESPLSIYKDNYFIAGNSEDQIKLQVSLKYNVLYPSNTGINFGYTQLSNWLIYKGRDTFYTTYQPETFYRFESGKNFLRNYEIPFVDYIQFSPICHNSTGVEGPDHRSINIYYGQIQTSYGEVYNIGMNAKYFRYYTISDENPDINKYRKNYEAALFFKVKSKTVEYLDKEELQIKFGGNPLKNGWYCIELQFRAITSIIQPKFFIQYYCGYSQFMTQYNRKDKSIRVGVTF
jgi:outer membrane phospholipase A